MAWLKIDDGFAEHPKIEALSDRELRIHVAAMCMSARNLTDGKVSPRDARALLGRHRGRMKHINRLVEVGVWAQTQDGWEINDYLHYNPTADSVREERRKAAQRMRDVRANVRKNKR